METDGKHVYLVTGGTGSLGTALAKHLLAQGHRVRAFARNEHSHEKLEATIPAEDRPLLSCLVGDVTAANRLELAMDGCDYLIHAAAAKVIPLCEYSPVEAIRTNIDGTINAALAAIKNAGVKRAVFVSTDKACSPSTLYGATKLCGERLWLQSNRYCPTSQKFVAVRYGNVFGSAGSVIHAWLAQVAEGKRLTVTDPNATRFHLRMNDAVTLVLRTLHLATPGDLWVPKLQTFRLSDLANAVDPGSPFDVSGLRAGEKLHESMISEDETIDARDAGDHFVLTPGIHQGQGRKAFHSGRPELRMDLETLKEEIETWKRSSSASAPARGVSAPSLSTSRTPCASSTL